MSIDHNKLIAAAAKETLSPLGLKRDGKSRVWYDDHGWWCIVVEFQPSSWSRGTYLNVGVCWLLFEKAHWTFDVGNREKGFSPARDESRFLDALSGITTHARHCITGYRERFTSIRRVHSYYQGIELQNHWRYYEAAVIAALDGDTASARRDFDALFALERPYQWQQGLYYRAMDLHNLLEDRRKFVHSVAGIVLRTRSQLRLDLYKDNTLGLPEFEGA